MEVSVPLVSANLDYISIYMFDITLLSYSVRVELKMAKYPALIMFSFGYVAYNLHVKVLVFEKFLFFFCLAKFREIF